MRRFAPPWTVETIPAGLKVCDANSQSLAYVYSRENPKNAHNGRGRAAKARPPTSRLGQVADMDDRSKAERHLNYQALKEAVVRMKPELRAASEVTHKYGADDTPDDSDFDRIVALGYLVEFLEGLRGPHLWVLNEIASVLYELHSEDEKSNAILL